MEGATNPAIDPSKCPLCGAGNACGAVAAGRPDPSCWCVGERFSAALLARVPEAARMRACICPACVAAAR